MKYQGLAPRPPLTYDTDADCIAKHECDNYALGYCEIVGKRREPCSPEHCPLIKERK